MASRLRQNLALVGGPGIDDVRIIVIQAGSPQAELDIPAGTFRLYTATPALGTLTGFETYTYKGGGPWDVLGRNAADYVNARGLGLGNPVQMNGSGGDDTLLAGGGDDVFDGGPGTDCIQKFTVPGDNGTDSTTSVELSRTDLDPDLCAWP